MGRGRPKKESSRAMKKMRRLRRTYADPSDCPYKKMCNGIISKIVAGMKNHCTVLDGRRCDSTKALISAGVSPKKITVVEVFKNINRYTATKLGAAHCNTSIGRYFGLRKSSQKRHGFVYFDFTGNVKSLAEFKRAIPLLRKRNCAKKLYIATSFHSGMFNKPTLKCEDGMYDECLDVMKAAFPRRCVRKKDYRKYKRRGGEMWFTVFSLTR